MGKNWGLPKKIKKKILSPDLSILEVEGNIVNMVYCSDSCYLTTQSQPHFVEQIIESFCKFSLWVALDIPSRQEELSVERTTSSSSV